MGWRDFEQAMACAFRQQGYGVTITPDGADGGVDLVLDYDGRRVLVQCKHWRVWTVGVRTVRELYGVMAVRGVTEGIVVTSGQFTRDAQVFAREANIRLLARRDVVNMLSQLPSIRRWPPPPQANSSPRCPRCGENMVVRTARRGARSGSQFWGCPRFPACHGITAITAANEIRTLASARSSQSVDVDYGIERTSNGLRVDEEGHRRMIFAVTMTAIVVVIPLALMLSLIPL